MKMPNLASSALLVLLATSTSLLRCRAQTVVLSGTNYAENFDALAAGLPSGWTVWDDATSSTLGTEKLFDPTATAWRLVTAGTFANFASTGNDNAGVPFTQDEDATTQGNATNRAPGLRLLSSLDPGAAFVVRIQDTIGFTNFRVSVDLMMMTTNARTGLWMVDYALGATPGSFTTLGTFGDLTLSGTNALNSAAFGKTNRALALPASVSDQGGNLWIRVALLAGTGPTGARDTYGIDNFSLSYALVPPSTNQPAITAHPQSRTNSAGTTATFTVEATGASPLRYQWWKGETMLVNSGNISGVTSPTLSLTPVVAGDAAGYSVVVTNDFGSATSTVATLTVTDPAIIASPASRTNVASDNVLLSATAAGTAPLHFQWRLNGADIPGASAEFAEVMTNYNFAITNVQASNQGAYTVVVSNSLGAVTSVVANVTLLATPPVHLAKWTFNSNPTDDDPTSGVTTPSLGSGLAAILPNNTQAFLGGSDSDPGSFGLDNSGWSIKGYPLQGTLNKQAGVQFTVSTTGHQDIFVTWEQLHNTRSSRYVRLQYSTNGTDFIDHAVIDASQSVGQFTLVPVNLAAVPGVSDNASFAFRLAAEFESTAIGGGNENYVAVDPLQTYGATAGAIRYDSVNVFGNLVGIAAPITITEISVAGGNARIDFTAGAGDSASSFTLRSSATVDGVYGDVSANITPLGLGLFRAERALSGQQQFYRIRR